MSYDKKSVIKSYLTYSIKFPIHWDERKTDAFRDTDNRTQNICLPDILQILHQGSKRFLLYEEYDKQYHEKTHTIPSLPI